MLRRSTATTISFKAFSGLAISSGAFRFCLVLSANVNSTVGFFRLKSLHHRESVISMAAVAAMAEATRAAESVMVRAFA